MFLARVAILNSEAAASPTVNATSVAQISPNFFPIVMLDPIGVLSAASHSYRKHWRVLENFFRVFSLPEPKAEPSSRSAITREGLPADKPPTATLPPAIQCPRHILKMLQLFRYRFRFRANDPLYFPPGKAGNILRGAFGTIFRKIACAASCAGVSSCEIRHQCAYAKVFEPQPFPSSPSGYSENSNTGNGTGVSFRSVWYAGLQRR